MKTIDYAWKALRAYDTMLAEIWTAELADDTEVSYVFTVGRVLLERALYRPDEHPLDYGLVWTGLNFRGGRSCPVTARWIAAMCWLSEATVNTALDRMAGSDITVLTIDMERCPNGVLRISVAPLLRELKAYTEGTIDIQPPVAA